MAAILMSKQVAQCSPFLKFDIESEVWEQVGMANRVTSKGRQVVSDQGSILVMMVRVVMPLKELVLRIPASVNVSNQVQDFLPRQLVQ